jgi:hypothetical protein
MFFFLARSIVMRMRFSAGRNAVLSLRAAAVLPAVLAFATTASGQDLSGPIYENNSPSASRTASVDNSTTASTGLLNPVAPSGILSQSKGHRPGILTRALGGLVTDSAHAAVALVGSTILNQSPDLPPDDETAPQWPFKEPPRKALFTVDWADGSCAKVSKLPDGSLQILGGGRRYMMQPAGDGKFFLFGDYGTMATVTRRPGGGFTIIKADGTVEQVLPLQGGGFTVNGPGGVVMATILPGVAGKKQVVRDRGLSSAGFMP